MGMFVTSVDALHEIARAWSVERKRVLDPSSRKKDQQYALARMSAFE